MALQLKEIFASLLNKPQFHAITADILLILILVELFRLLIIDLQEQRGVDRGLRGDRHRFGAVREVIVSGVLEADWHQVLAVCLFLARSVGAPPPFCSSRHQEGLHCC